MGSTDLQTECNAIARNDSVQLAKGSTSLHKEIAGDKSFTGVSSLSQPAGYLKK